MNKQYRSPMPANCPDCQLRKEGWFCVLSSELLTSLSALSHAVTYAHGEILFRAGEMPTAGLILCSGKVKQSTMSKEGKVLLLKVAIPER